MNSLVHILCLLKKNEDGKTTNYNMSEKSLDLNATRGLYLGVFITKVV